MGKPPLPQKPQSGSVKAFNIAWMRLTDIMQSDLLYSKSTNFNVNLIYKIPSQQHPNIWAPRLAKMTQN